MSFTLDCKKMREHENEPLVSKGNGKEYSFRRQVNYTVFHNSAKKQYSAFRLNGHTFWLLLFGRLTEMAVYPEAFGL